MDLSRPYMNLKWQVDARELPFEFFMNRFRLLEPCPKQDFNDLTGLPLEGHVADNLALALNKGLLLETKEHWQLSPLGRRYLNSLLELLV